MRKLLIALVSLALLGALAGCGSSGGSDDASDAEATTTSAAVDDEPTTTADGADVSAITAEEYEAALVENLSSGSEDDGQLVIERSQAECMAPKWVDAITVDLLHENGVTVEALSDPGFSGSSLGMERSQGEAMVDAFGACDVDIVALFSAAFAQGLSAEQQTCVADNVDPDLVRELLAATFSSGSSDTEFAAVLDQLGTVCELPSA